MGHRSPSRAAHRVQPPAQLQLLQVQDLNTRRVVRIDEHFHNPARYFFHLHVKAGEQLWTASVSPTDAEHVTLAWLGETILHYHVRMELLRRAPPGPHCDSSKKLSAAAAAYTCPDALAELDAHFHLRAWRQARQPDAWRLGTLRLASVMQACLGAAHRLHGGALDQELVTSMMDIMDGEAVPGVCCCKNATKACGWLWNTPGPLLCCHQGVPAQPSAPPPPRTLRDTDECLRLQHSVSMPHGRGACAAGQGEHRASLNHSLPGKQPAAAVPEGKDHWSGWNVVNTQLHDPKGATSYAQHMRKLSDN